LPAGKSPVGAEVIGTPPRADAVQAAIEPVEAVPVEPVCNTGELPLPQGCASPWAPPGIAGPWPHDEYLLDGGDRDAQVNVGAQREIRGLELEDTVAVYDTYHGTTCIEPSNRVCLYAPRFAAVRKVDSLVQNLQNEQPIGVDAPVIAHLNQEDQLATTTVQPIQPVGHIATRQPSLERVEEGVLPAISRLPIMALDGGFATYENLRVIRQGVFEDAEKALLLESVQAAIAWTHKQAVQVTLDGRAAVDVTGDQRAQATFRVDEPNHPCLRVIKIASKKTAKPGEIVDFTIRFDNTGDQAIKHVTLVDNLTTRLEYVPGTAQSSRQAEFNTEVNEGESLVLRWEFTEPLPASAGGLVRFHCRVR
jgi:uncharacterized repeat protein (TIGR01451 family)